MATVEYKPTGSRCRALGGDPRRAHGLASGFLALMDEPAQWDPAKSERLLSAIKTGLGKVPGSRLIALGTRPANPHALVHSNAGRWRGATLRPTKRARPIRSSRSNVAKSESIT